MSEQITLFDVDNQPIKVTFRSNYQKWKYENKYCKADQYSDIRCGNCKYMFGVRLLKRIVYKCELLGISHSQATDIRLSNTCRNFEPEIKEATNEGN